MSWPLKTSLACGGVPPPIPFAGKGQCLELNLGTLIWIALLAVWVFFPAYDSYIWDDQLLVLQNGNTTGLDALSRLWVEDLWARVPGEHAHHWYRPLMTLSLWLDQQIFGHNIVAALCHSALYALLCAVLLWRLLKHWGVKAALPYLHSAYFAFIPFKLKAFALSPPETI